MLVKVWGTRGSMPVSGTNFGRYGGDTSCLEVRTDDGNTIILDAGSGLGALDRAMKSGVSPEFANPPLICLSHTHLDHVQGLPFLSGIYSGQAVIYGPVGSRETINRLFDGALFPVKPDTLEIEVREISSGARFNVGNAVIETMSTNHPGSCLAWKITADGWTFVYGADHEIPLSQNDKNVGDNEKLPDFMAGADVVLVDGHFSGEDHIKHAGWGHSHPEQWIGPLQDRKVGQILFGHFSPTYPDEKIDALVRGVRKKYPGINMDAVWQGCTISAKGIDETEQSGEECQICAFFKRTASLSDTHAVLETLLTEARKLGNADAGTVYLVQDGELAFSAAQNDTLFPASAANKFFYMNSRIPISKSSIAGYVAATGSILNIPDVYELPEGCEYNFNADFDRQSGYRTKSVLAVPLLDAKGKIAGVLQLINSLEQGETVPFTKGMEKNISALAAMATVPLERSFLLTSMILRMLQTSALRDPAETAGHVWRVGGMAAELYHKWAEAHGVEPEELLSTKGILRLAAMLHDVGKVGIPDAVLKKPGKLDDGERAIMEKHAALGASLFGNGSDFIEKIAADIALYHHAKWNGKGYTGDESIPAPAGEDIPLWARITAIADVYDALVSRRCYKDAWDSGKALEILRKDAGTHFDPELVELFIGIHDTIEAVMNRYK